MEKSFGKAFSYLFRAENWRKNAGILYLLYFVIYAFICTFLANSIAAAGNLKDPVFAKQRYIFDMLFPVVTILAFFISGYRAKCGQAVIKSEDSFVNLLPAWSDNFLGYFIIGTKQSGAYAAIFVLLLPGIILLGIPFLFLFLIGAALDRIFFEDFKFDSYFAWAKGFKLIGNNVALYFEVIFTEILLMFLGLVILIPLFFYKVSPCLIAFLYAFYSTYVVFVIAYLKGIIGNKKLPQENEVTQIN